MVDYYKKAGYDGIIITDHYFDGYFESLSCSRWDDKVDCYLSGYKAAVEEGERVGLRVYLGMEIRFEEGPEDYLVYGIDEEYIRENPELYRHTLESYRESIKGTDILIFQAHPYRKGLKVADPTLLDGIEIMNGNPRHDSHNDLALAFAEKHGLMMTAGSDAHQLEDVGRGGIMICDCVSSSKELARWLRENDRYDLYIPEHLSSINF
jgi:predicted metal-dependent phosphoesterase TrpH